MTLNPFNWANFLLDRLMLATGRAERDPDGNIVPTEAPEMDLPPLNINITPAPLDEDEIIRINPATGIPMIKGTQLDHKGNMMGFNNQYDHFYNNQWSVFDEWNQ